MNPLRALYIGLSRIPPAAGLIVIVGLAVVAAGLSAQHIKTIEDQYNALARNAKNVPKEKIVFLAQKVPDTDFESRLSKGMRAVTFAVDTGSGVAGFVSPESRVDIMATVGSGAETKAGTILSNVRVVAVGQVYKRAKDGAAGNPASSVTVEVNPTDAQKLVKAVVASKLYLALRGQSDSTPMATLDIRSLYGKEPSDDILASSPVPLPPAPAGMPKPLSLSGSPQYKVEVWTGKEKNVVHFER